MRRHLFLVGCPRSGTTLLQSLLAAHSQICSFPETHFFLRTIAGRAWARRLGLAARSSTTHYAQMTELIGHPDLIARLPPRTLLLRQYARAFSSALDEAARRQGRTIWLEKTPGHLHHIREISETVPDAAFIHIVRNAPDVVASLYEVTHKHPEVWGGERTMDQCLERWQQDVTISARYRLAPDHCVVRYEHLLDHPTPLLENLCTFAGVPFEPSMLSGRQQAAERIIQQTETWKATARESIQDTRNRKFHSLFTPEEQGRVLAQSRSIDLDSLCTPS
ncbi:MAG: sulfotransferase family protein [Chthonomonadales bacterium]|nr:sulfotransferase family protein [Chthonomonadales bacterium]